MITTAPFVRRTNTLPKHRLGRFVTGCCVSFMIMKAVANFETKPVLRVKGAHMHSTEWPISLGRQIASNCQWQTGVC
jgi:hypothetical protein